MMGSLEGNSRDARMTPLPAAAMSVGQCLIRAASASPPGRKALLLQADRIRVGQFEVSEMGGFMTPFLRVGGSSATTGRSALVTHAVWCAVEFHTAPRDPER